MAINYLHMRATATRLLTENGKTFTGYRPGKVERINGEEVVTDDQPLKVVGVLVDYKPHEIDGKTILTGDQKMSCTYAVAVQVGDIFTIDGQSYRVENPWPVKPANTLICYKPQLRGV